MSFSQTHIFITLDAVPRLDESLSKAFDDFNLWGKLNLFQLFIKHIEKFIQT